MYAPLTSSLTVKRSTIHGLGLYATAPIGANTDLGITHVADERFEDGYIRTPLGGFYNHSMNPNCCIIEENDCLRLITIAHIEANAELTAHYTLYEVS